MTNDPNHTANQYNVARRLAAVLTTIPSFEHEDVQIIRDEHWPAVVANAQAIDPTWKPRKGYVPSESTKRLVAAMIRAETAPTPTTDPFAGIYGVDD